MINRKNRTRAAMPSSAAGTAPSHRSTLRHGVRRLGRGADFPRPNRQTPATGHTTLRAAKCRKIGQLRQDETP